MMQTPTQPFSEDRLDRAREGVSPDTPLSPIGHQNPLSFKTARTLAVMIAVLSLPYASPRLGALRVVQAPWEKDVTASDGTVPEPPIVPPPVLTLGDTAVKPSTNEATVTNALPASVPTSAIGTAANPAPSELALLAKLPAPVTIEDPTGHAMDAFYAQLARTTKKEPGAVTRVLHYGDSIVTGDYISGTIRRRLQGRFGDSGHGFILIANPIDWYFHNDVVHKASEGWYSSRVVGPLTKDGIYGLGGATFHTTGNASATFGTTEKGEFGRNVSHFDVYYLEHESGGKFEISIDGKVVETFVTKGPAKVSRIKSVNVPDGPATLVLRAAGGGDTRLFGVALERDAPGVQVDALGLAGGRAALWETMDAGHWSEQMALRKPSLIVVQYGTNESEVGSGGEAYEKALGTFLDRLKAAAPMASILIASPVDRAEKTDKGDYKTKEIIVKIVNAQRRIALAHGVAFWNTFEAMGGRGTVRRWLFTKPNLYNWDYTHPTTQGAEVIGDLVVGALMTGYEGYASTHPEAPKLPQTK
jgi:lysophospholipase L1-like esterase